MTLQEAAYLKLDDKYEHALRKIEEQQLLLNRAADALERIEAAKHWQWTIDLAAELRKAAQ